MKLSILPLALVSVLLLGSIPAYAGLIPIGGGLIYDNDRNITWLQNANLAATNTFGVNGINASGTMNWYTAQSWIAAMNDANYLGYSDWRLPSTLNSCSGYNCTESEMGHLYYTELGNAAGVPLANTGLFINLLPYDSYWSGTEYMSSSTLAWAFGFDHGGQHVRSKSDYYYAMAVRDGDSSPVPEPSLLILLGIGTSGVIGVTAWRNKRSFRRENNS